MKNLRGCTVFEIYPLDVLYEWYAFMKKIFLETSSSSSLKLLNLYFPLQHRHNKFKTVNLTFTFKKPLKTFLSLQQFYLSSKPQNSLSKKFHAIKTTSIISLNTSKNMALDVDNLWIYLNIFCSTYLFNDSFMECCRGRRTNESWFYVKRVKIMIIKVV